MSQHGGNIYAAAMELGVPWHEILDFSASINPLGAPPGLKEHLFDQFGLTLHYPDPYGLAWRKGIAAGHGLDPEEVLAGNGTTALMYLLARVFKPTRPVIPAPAFGEYEESLVRMAGVAPEYVYCHPDNSFELTETIIREVFERRPDMVYICNPTSPAGRIVERDVIGLALDLAESSGARIVLDEAFLDFAGVPSMAGLVRDNPGLIILRSMTKFHALPGLRLGYLAASSEVVAEILASAEPWSVNSLALEAGLYCLDKCEFARETVDTVTREREWLTGQLERFFTVIRGAANYILMKIDIPGLTEESLIRLLRQKGILVRGCASFQGILKGYIRIAVKARSQNEKLVAALEDILSK